MSACDNFVENVWSKGKCSNCFKSLASHKSSGVAERTRKSDKLFGNETNGITREREYHTGLNRWPAKSDGAESRDGVAKARNTNERSMPARTKIAKSPVVKQTDRMERNAKPALSPKPKPVPKPRQRSSNVGLTCGQKEELTPQQTLSKVEPLRATSIFNNSEPVSEGAEIANTKRRETERDSKPDIPSSKPEQKHYHGTVENEPSADKEQKSRRTVLPTENNHLESAETYSSKKVETQYEGGEDEYVPMKDNVFDIVKIMENCGADVLDRNGDKPRSNSETSSASSNSVFESSEQHLREIRNERAEDFNGDTDVLAKKSSTKLSGNPNDSDRDCDVSSESCGAGVNPPTLRFVGKNPSVADSPKTVEFGWDSRMFESSSDVQENSACCLEMEGISTRKQSLGELCITGTLHGSFGSKSLRRQSNPDIKEQMPEPPIYVNSDVKRSTKPYKVVDVSTGMLVTDEQGETPPLPPKAKDLVLGSQPHDYMEPTEGPREPLDRGQVKSTKGCVARPYSAVDLSNGATVPSTSHSEPSDLMRHSMLAPSTQPIIPTHIGTNLPGSTSALQEEKPPTDENATQPGEPAAAKPADLLPSKVASDDNNASASQKSTTDVSSIPRPTRSAPTRPNYSPPVVSAQKDSVMSVAAGSPSVPSNQPQDPPGCQPGGKSSSPKSAIKKAFTSMKRIGSKKRGKRRTLEISGPILVNEEIPSFAAQQEAVRQRALSEGNVLQAPQPTEARVEFSMQAGPPLEGETATSPPVPARKRPGYENYPFSRSGGTMEKPTKPPRKARTKAPARDTASAHVTEEKQTEEPAYLEPAHDELTFKVEAALANLNDAAILAEALSRVEQEKLGPLPAIPKSRHVRFHIASPDASPNPPAANPDGAPPVGEPPELPSRPPNRAASKKQSNHRGRSQSVREVRNPEGRAVKLTRSQSLSAQENTLQRRYNQLLKLQMQTLGEVVESQRISLLPKSGLDWGHTQWADYEVCGPAVQVELPGGAVLLPVRCARLSGHRKILAKVYTRPALTGDRQANQEQTALQHDLRLSTSLPRHLNIARVMTHFDTTIPGDVIGRADCGACRVTVAISDQLPVETVSSFVERTVSEHDSCPETYERKVCLLLVQLLSGLAHLSREGVVHCALTMENLLLLEHDHLVISNFLAASRAADVRADGGLGTKLRVTPPELAAPGRSGASLDYSKCDCFAVGCLLYQLLHRKNPFVANVALARHDYEPADLPVMCRKSCYSRGLGTVAHQLLLMNPGARMSAVEALQLVRMLLWGPGDLDSECVQSAAGDWLETERAQMVAKIARSQMEAEPNDSCYLETFLKGQYLYDATEESLAQCYTLLKHS